MEIISKIYNKENQFFIIFYQLFINYNNIIYENLSKNFNFKKNLCIY